MDKKMDNYMKTTTQALGSRALSGHYAGMLLQSMYGCGSLQ